MGNGRFSDGLILGAVLGGAAVFLLGTKKGNKVLKVLTEEGMAGISEFMEELQEARGEAGQGDEEVDDDFEEIVIEEVRQPKANISSAVPPLAPKPKPKKRFFRKTK